MSFVFSFAAMFVDVVAPTISLVPTLASHIARESRELVRLTKDQMQVLDMAEAQDRVGVEGVAAFPLGSGSGSADDVFGRDRRAMSVSTDGGATWRGLWLDELRRSPLR